MRSALTQVWPFAAALLAASPLPASDAGLTLGVRARAFAPGEVALVRVEASRAVGEVSGTWGGERLAFVADGEQAEPTPAHGPTWWAWAVIDLDAPAGPTEVVVTARDAAGAVLEARRTVEVAAKRFPEQHLTVEKAYVSPPPAAQERIARERKRLAAIYAVRRPALPPREVFVRPVPGEPTGVFGSRRVFNGQKRDPHSGLDLRAATGTRVHASGEGVVVLADDLYYSGLTVIVDHGAGLFTVYAHLSALKVAEGERVAAGRLVGLSGATGRVTGPHLHWGAKLGDRIFDPTALLDPALFVGAPAS